MEKPKKINPLKRSCGRERWRKDNMKQGILKQAIMVAKEQQEN